MASQGLLGCQYFVAELRSYINALCPQIAQLSADVKIQLGFESQPPPKRPFVTVFSKIYVLAKTKKLGTWQDSKFVPFFFVLYQGTLGLLLMSLKWHQS